MKLINRYYRGQETLDALSAEIPATAGTLLIQVYSCCHDVTVIRQLLGALRTRFPNAQLVGMTCYAAIAGEDAGKSSKLGDKLGDIQGDILLSLLLAETVQVHSAAIEASARASIEDIRALGRRLAAQVVQADTRALLLFTNNDGMDPTALLEGVEAICPGIPISGGAASTDPASSATGTEAGGSLVWHNDTISQRGAVLVALGGRQLQAHQDMNMGLAPLGKPMRVTRVEGNRVFTLDDEPALSAYRRYLGAEVADNLPHSAMGFPLLARRHGMEVTVAARALCPGGSIRYSAPLAQGELVHFGFPSAERMLDGATHLRDRLLRQGPAQALLVFACPTRTWILGENAHLETDLLSAFAPLAGCLTGGEFSHNGSGQQFLNQSMTVLSLRESTDSETGKAAPPCTSAMKPVLESIHLRMVKVLHGMVTRISDELAASNQALERERLFYRTLIEESLDGVALFDACGQSLYQSPANTAIYGWKPEEIQAMNVNRTLVHPDDQATMYNLWKRLSTSPGTRERLELRLLHRDGHWITIEAQIRNCLQMPGVHAMVNYFRDITELKHLESELRRLATTDSLTLLANRRHFMERARQERRRAQRNATELAVIMMDIDHFKQVNDTYGHAAGDRVIVAVAELLQDMMRDQDVAGRLGGEEFALLLPDTSIQGAVIVAERLRASLEARVTRVTRVTRISGQLPGQSGEVELRVTASFGLASMQNGKGSVDLLIRQADDALYQAKNAGRNCVRWPST